jgi:hypothetical protein
VVVALDHIAHEQAHGVGPDVDGGVCEIACDAAKLPMNDRRTNMTRDPLFSSIHPDHP